MGITIRFPKEPTKEDMEKFQKTVEKFAGIAGDTLSRAETLIGRVKTPTDILACKFIAKHRHSETMKLINKKDREIKKKQKIN